MEMRTRIFFVTDLHGSNRCFRKFLNSAKVYDADAIILGGDITGKTLVPVIRLTDGSYRLSRMGTAMELKSDEQLSETVKELGDSGAYTAVMDQKEFDELHSSETARNALFIRLIMDRLKEWFALAEERLKGTGVSCYVSPGNDDAFEVDSVLNSSEFVINPEDKVVELEGGFEMITLGFTNHTPWHSPREVDEEELATKISKMTSQVKRMSSAVFNLHVPPIETSIDQAPKVGENLRYVATVGQVEMTSAGSTAVRRAIEVHQPMLGVHGHIHESRGVVNIGRTICANPGSEYGEGILRGFIADLEGDKVKSYLLTSG